MSVLYSQCWEDPRLLMQTLNVGPGDRVLSIASGGDNSFALLLGNPDRVTAVDFNPEQVFLVNLKVEAMRRLSYEEFVRFVGALPCRERSRIFARLLPHLDVLTADYWLRHHRDIDEGVIHCGRFERYLAVFRRLILPLIHSPAAVETLLTSPTVDVQREVYAHLWENRRWQWLFQLFFGRFVMAALGRRPEFFRYAEDVDVADTLYERVRRGLTDVPIADNFFVEYILTGRYGRLSVGPPYLQPECFHAIKARLDRMQVVCMGLGTWAAGCPPGTYSKFNLSDVFEYMSETEALAMMRQLVRIARPDGRMAFWSLFVDRPVPSDLLCELGRGNGGPVVHDRAFFYDRLTACRVRAGAA